MISSRRSPTSHPAEKQNAKREASALTDNRCFRPRACLKNHFRNLRAPLCGIFYPHSVDVARYAALIRIKSPTNWDSQLTKSLFQTRSSCYSVPEKFFTDDAYSDGVIRVNFLNCKEKYW